MEDEAIEWVPVRDVMRAYFKTYDGPGEKPLRDAASMGAVTLRASFAELGGGVRGKTEVVRDYTVPAKYWGRNLSPDFAFSQNRAAGAIAYTRGFGNAEAFKFMGLCVNKAEAEAALGIELGRVATAGLAIPAEVQPAPVKNPGGRKRASEKWDPVIVSIAWLANEGYFDPTMPQRFETQTAARDAIIERVAQEGIEVDHPFLTDTVRKVWYAVREPSHKN